ncbi:MAG: hypothetical protein R2838_06685 [Caldilineaceae bacterium]
MAYFPQPDTATLAVMILMVVAFAVVLLLNTLRPAMAGSRAQYAPPTCT